MGTFVSIPVDRHRRVTPSRRGLGIILCGFVALVVLAEPASSLPWVIEQLTEVHRERQHVRYQFGGCNSSKMDCSCFVQTAFRDAFGQKLPRSTLGQARFFGGSILPRLDDIRRLGVETLCPGDLIYTFRGDQWQTASRHVAIYFDRGRILHSASGVGVEIQPLRVLGHHRLHGVVRLFECRGASPTPPRRPAARRPDRRAARREAPRIDAHRRSLREEVDRFFTAWQTLDQPAFASLWAEGGVQWRKGTQGSSFLSDWRRSFRELGGQQWIYGVRALAIRGTTAFVEVETEQTCPKTGRRDCGLTIQTFVWQHGPDGSWRIAQHEIGPAD